MATKQTKAPKTGKYKAIEELIEITLRERQDSKRIKELRESAKDEAVRLYKANHWPMGTDQEYGDGTIRLYTEYEYTWEQNHQLDDPMLDVYRTQFEHVKWLNDQLLKNRATLKRYAKDLADEHPESESIKPVIKFQIR